MKIIIDTNIIHGDYHLRGKYIVTLSDAAKKLGYEVCIPEVVVDEIENQYKEELNTAYNNYTKNILNLEKLLPFSIKPSISDESIIEALNDFRRRYERELQLKNIKVLPYPKVDHKFMVAKELNKKKPFKDSKKGYRDALIWETVKAELIPVKDLFDEIQILLLSCNTNDFASGNKLHNDLKQELLDLGYGENVIKLQTNCEAFFKDVIYPEFEELDKIKDALNTKGAYNRISVDKDFAPLFGVQFVEHVVDKVDEYGLNLHLPLYCENPYVESVNNHNIYVDSVIRLEDDTVMIGCSVVINAEISYYLERANAADAFDDVHPHVMNYEHNDYYLEVSNLVEIKATVNFRTTRTVSKVLTTEVVLETIRLIPYES